MLRRGLDVVSLWLFAPALILVGILGFVVPPEQAATSGAPAYNVFHLVFGVIGIGCAASKRQEAITGFLVGFGLIDLYQLLASWLHLFPESHFRWTKVDDLLHLVFGVALVVVGLVGPRLRGGTVAA